MSRRQRTPWVDVRMEVCFEETEMMVLHRGGWQKRSIVTPVFRLPDGTEFTGRRIGNDLRLRIYKTADLRGGLRRTR